jgi:quinol monooxygenase YgiN
MYALVVEFEILDGHSQGFDVLVAETVAAITRNEPGTLVYVTHTRSDNPNVRIFYECYRDHDAFLTHEQQPHTARFLRERDQHLARPPAVWRLQPAPGPSPDRRSRRPVAATNPRGTKALDLTNFSPRSLPQRRRCPLSVATLPR